MPKLLRLPAVFLALGIGLLVSIFAFCDFSDKLENHVFDFFARRNIQPSRWPTDIAVITIDDQSLQTLSRRVGRWPWPRDVQAGIVAYLKKAGAKAIVFDILFAEESEDAFNDELFASYLSATQPVWLAAKTSSSIDHKKVFPLEILRKATGDSIGFVNTIKEEGVVRDYNFKATDDSKIDALSVAVAKKLGLNVPNMDRMRLQWYGQAHQLPSYSAAEVALTGLNLIDWIKTHGSPKNFEITDSSKVALLLQQAPIKPALELKDKIVFVGCSAAATYDAYTTPVEKHQSGVYIHATALGNIIQSSYFREVSDSFRVILILLSSAGVTLVCRKIRYVSLQVFFTFLLIGSVLLFSFLCYKNNIWFPPALAVVSIVLSYASINAYNYVVEGREKRLFKQLFSDFVSPDVLEELMSSDHGLDLTGDLRMGTVLFCDLSGFTTFTESATPSQLIDAINSYYSEATKILQNHYAYVDKYIGDAVMAIFNIPKQHPDHAAEACFAALELPGMIKNLNSRLQEQYPGLELKLRTGVNTGMMIAGPMGYARKRNYSALGDSVNLASRLEGANKEYHSLIMIGPVTYDLARDKIEARPLDFLKVKGKNKSVRVYELMSKKGELSETQIKMRAAYNEGFELYQHRQWNEAISAFQRAMQHVPDDGPSEVYISRCEYFSKNPPPPDWDGSFALDTK